MGSEKGESSGSGQQVKSTVWVAKVIIFVDYLEKIKTITWTYCALLLQTPEGGKHPHLKKKKVLLHQNNANVHTHAVSIVNIVVVCCFTGPFVLSSRQPEKNRPTAGITEY